MNVLPSARWMAQLDDEIDALRRREADLLEERARREAARGIYRCVVCREAYVDAENGFDTCADCAERV